MEKKVDLHIHTTASDGSLDPADAVTYAKKIGLSAVAIADHDSTAGILPALRTGRKLDIEVIPAIELSSEAVGKEFPELHLLGYWIDWRDRELQEKLIFFRNARKKRAFTIIEKLQKCRVYLEQEELMKIADTGSIGRLHFAKELLAQKYVHNIHEAFDKYLANGKPAYVPKERFSAKDAINLITRTGGIPVLAHPLFGSENNINIIRTLRDYGLLGLEVYHPRHTKAHKKMFEQMAKELNLVMTGGSDCHGGFNGSKPQMGVMNIPYSVLENLRKIK